ncbi:hypothetical protein RRG08_010187 [Elysia crispata]|uniref:Uncharacterized protein n=1 Tax=Elysia crispata TaxID=231223 RepID=A0AAE1E115_9GAST|nr:hypothetical protein RRG08_010187 [Elysia crispata]
MSPTYVSTRLLRQNSQQGQGVDSVIGWVLVREAPLQRQVRHGPEKQAMVISVLTSDPFRLARGQCVVVACWLSLKIVQTSNFPVLFLSD